MRTLLETYKVFEGSASKETKVHPIGLCSEPLFFGWWYSFGRVMELLVGGVRSAGVCYCG